MNSTERHEARYQRRKAARDASRRAKLSVYDDFYRVANINALIRAHFETRKGVLWKASVARYDAKFYKFAVRTSQDMFAGRNVCEGFYSFGINERGKHRDVHSLHYAERVIRRSVCINALVPMLSSNLIYDNGASLEGKGVSFSLDRCETHLHQFYRETGGNDGYILVIDFSKYFDNIHYKPLFQMLDRVILDTQLNRLVKSFVLSANAVKEDHDKGLFIGPEDSQIYAVHYHSRIDHLIKDKWRVRYYNIYMDDSYIIMQDKEQLGRIRDMLFAEYEKLGIIPNKKKTQIVKLRRGFTYLKTKFYLTDNGKVIRKPDHNNIVRERGKLKKFRRFMDEGVMTQAQINQQYMSWRGFILQKDSYRTVQSMDALFFELFGCRPWKNIKNHSKRRKRRHGKARRNPG